MPVSPRQTPHRCRGRPFRDHPALEPPDQHGGLSLIEHAAHSGGRHENCGLRVQLMALCKIK
jgi:hypothetical protein